MYELLQRLISDRGTCFTTKLFEEFCSELRIEHILTSSHHPQANRQVERSYSILMTTLMTSLMGLASGTKCLLKFRLRSTVLKVR